MDNAEEAASLWRHVPRVLIYGTVTSFQVRKLCWRQRQTDYIMHLHILRVQSFVVCACARVNATKVLLKDRKILIPASVQKVQSRILDHLDLGVGGFSASLGYRYVFIAKLINGFWLETFDRKVHFFA